MKSLRIIVSGGGTGGHIFPALAIADEIKKRIPDSEFLFVGAKGKMEMDKVPKAGYKIIGLNISGISRGSILKNISFPFKFFKSVLKSQKIIEEFKPDLAIGTGGFVSAPILYASSFKVPIFIQESNALPGITNKKLAKGASKIFVSYDGMERFFPNKKVLNFGNPIRKSLIEGIIPKQEAKEKLGFSKDLPLVFSFGGSLGSKTLNNFWRKNLDNVLNLGSQVIWQTGEHEYNDISLLEITKRKHVCVKDFIYDMALVYSAADIIISRAGAMAISEMAIFGKAVILVPFPHAAENHQTKNAAKLVDKNAAIMVSDYKVEDELFDKIKLLVQDKIMRNLLGENILKFAKPDSIEKIVDAILTDMKSI